MQTLFRVIDDNKKKEIQLSTDLEGTQTQLQKAQADLAKNRRGTSEITELKKELQGVKAQLKTAEEKLHSLRGRIISLVDEGEE